jgi:hypothetical protein
VPYSGENWPELKILPVGDRIWLVLLDSGYNRWNFVTGGFSPYVIFFVGTKHRKVFSGKHGPK